LLRGKRFVIKDGMYYVPCNKRLYESLYIRTVNESYWLELPPENFIIPVSFNKLTINLGIGQPEILCDGPRGELRGLLCPRGLLLT
jgi:hypothetical protein